MYIYIYIPKKDPRGNTTWAVAFILSTQGDALINTLISTSKVVVSPVMLLSKP